MLLLRNKWTFCTELLAPSLRKKKKKKQNLEQKTKKKYTRHLNRLTWLGELRFIHNECSSYKDCSTCKKCSTTEGIFRDRDRLSSGM
jgi:hypothetical protein